MYRKLLNTTILVVMILFSNQSYSAWGFGPCCGPYVCGIFPCDSGCAGAAINQMGSSVGNSVSNLEQAYRDEGDALQDIVDSMNNFSTDLTTILADNNNKYLQALSASTNRIELSVNQQQKTYENMSGHSLNTITTALKQSYVLDAINNNNKQYSDISQPLSGHIGVDRAGELKAINAKEHQIKNRLLSNYRNYIEDNKKTDSSAGRSINNSINLSIFDDNNKVHSLLTKSVVDDVSSENYQKILSLFGGLNPIAKKSGESDAEYELNRRRYNAMLVIVMSTFYEQLVTRKGLGEKDLNNYYINNELNADNKISSHSIYSNDSIGRLTDSEWYGSIKRLNKSGIERELIYQQAISSRLEKRMLDLSKSGGHLSSLIGHQYVVQ